MSSAVPERTDRPSASALAPDAVTTEPKALKRMLGNDRPMAWLIIRVSSVPEAPTSVPATMSKVLFKVKPEAATARPVKALSSEMSTGVSAPPMGSTKMAPNTSDSTSTTTSTVVLAVTTVTTSSATMAIPMPALIGCWPGR